MGEGGSTSSRDRQWDASNTARLRGLLLLGADQLVGSARCLKADCHADITPTDICCPEHGDVLERQPLQPMTWPPWFVRLLSGLVAITAIPFAARFDTPFIVFGIWSAIGAAICRLIAFRWRETGRVLPLGWCVAAGMAAVIRLLDMHPEWSSVKGLAAWLELVMVTSAIGVSLWLCFRLSALMNVVDPGSGYRDADDEAITLLSVGMTRGLLTVVALCLAAFVSDSRLLSRVSSDADAITPWLWQSALFSVIGTVLGVLGVCLFRSWVVVDTAVKPLTKPPVARRSLRWSKNAIARADEDGKRSLGERGVIAVVKVVETAVYLVLGVARVMVVLIFATVNKVARLLTLIARHIVATLRFVSRTIISSGRIFLAVLARYVRGTGIPGVALVVATYATWSSATHETHYLHRGPMSDVAIGALFGLAAALLIFLARRLMTGASAGASRQSMSNVVADRGMPAGLCVVTAGWIDGIAGRFGAGSMSVGPITLVGSILLVAGTPWLYSREPPATEEASGTNSATADRPVQPVNDRRTFVDPHSGISRGGVATAGES